MDAFLAKKRKNASFSLEKIEGTMGGGDSAIAAEWVDQVMALAYEGFFFPFHITFEMTLHCFYRGEARQEIESTCESSQRTSKFPHGISASNL